MIQTRCVKRVLEGFEEKDLSEIVVHTRGELSKLKQPDVTEVYSPERVVAVAQNMGLVSGMTMDLLSGWIF